MRAQGLGAAAQGCWWPPPSRRPSTHHAGAKAVHLRLPRLLHRRWQRHLGRAVQEVVKAPQQAPRLGAGGVGDADDDAGAHRRQLGAGGRRLARQVQGSLVDGLPAAVEWVAHADGGGLDEEGGHGNLLQRYDQARRQRLGGRLRRGHQGL